MRAAVVGFAREWGWAVWAVVILLGAVLPPDWLLGVAPRSSWSLVSTVAHSAEFALLAGLLSWRSAARRPAHVPTGADVAIACAAAAAAALVVELLQWPLPYRGFEAVDLLADAGGIALAAVGFTLFARRRAGRASAR